MTEKEHATAAKLRQLATDLTEHPGDAAVALIVAAGSILHDHLGTDAALAALREIVEDTGEALIRHYSQRAGETVQ